MTKLPQIKSIRTVAKSRLFDIEEVDLQFSNGNQACYERLGGSSIGGILVVPLLDNDTILLVREYSVGFERYELGFVKGRVENGESPESAAGREMQEEIGFGAKEYRFLTSVSLWPNYSPFWTSIFLATDLYESSLKGDEPEALEIVPYPISNIELLRRSDDFTDARSMLATYLIQDNLSNIND